MKKPITHWGWWLTTVIPAFKRPRQAKSVLEEFQKRKERNCVFTIVYLHRNK
jgi:hypothetical protein